jgi:hypothetical protein
MQTVTIPVDIKSSASPPKADPYREITDALHALMLSKSGYYGNPEGGPLANALSVIDDGIEPWRYQLARIGEKCRRLRGNAATDTRILKDTLTDIAGHAIVALACLNAEQ